MNQGSFEEVVLLIAAFAVPGLLAITCHEVAHGWVARYFGDRTAEMLGRLSLNPIRHVDPVGTVLVPITMLVFTSFVFGWARPVPVAQRNLGRPRRDMVYVAAAGPAANLAMALGWGLFLAAVEALAPSGTRLTNGLLLVGQLGIFINVVLAVFNLLPVPPLDGGRLLGSLLPARIAYHLERVEPYGIVIVLVLLLTGVLWPILRPVISGLTGLVHALAGAG